AVALTALEEDRVHVRECALVPADKVTARLGGGVHLDDAAAPAPDRHVGVVRVLDASSNAHLRQSGEGRRSRRGCRLQRQFSLILLALLLLFLLRHGWDSGTFGPCVIMAGRPPRGNVPERQKSSPGMPKSDSRKLRLQKGFGKTKNRVPFPATI